MAEFCDPRHELCHDETRKGLAKVDKSGWNKGQPTCVENGNKNKFQPNKMSTKMKSDMKKLTEKLEFDHDQKYRRHKIKICHEDLARSENKNKISLNEALPHLMKISKTKSPDNIFLRR